MTSYTAFYDEVLPEVPGCPQPVALNAIRNACIEFCQRSRAYVYNHPAINAVINTPTYAFVPPASTLVVMILQAFYNGKQIFPKTPDELKEIYCSSDWRDKTGTPKYYTQDDERNVRLVPMPEASLANALKLRVALKPTRASTTIEDRLYEDYLEIIKDGALYRLKKSINKPYSDAQGAAASLILFNNGIDEAKSKVEKGHVRARQRTTPHYF